MKIQFEASTPAASPAIKILYDPDRYGLKMRHKINFEIEPNDNGKITAASIQIQGSRDNTSVPSGLSTPADGDGSIITPDLGLGITTTNIAHALFYYLLDGVNYSKAENITGVPFSVSHKIAASKFGAIAVYIDAAGNINTAINSLAQTDTLSFDTAQEAINNVLASDFPHFPDSIRIGYILIENNASLWTANVDDMTNGSDVAEVTFHSVTSSFTIIDIYDLSDADIDLQKGSYYLTPDKPDIYMRLFVSEIIGNGKLTIIDQLIPENRTHLQGRVD
jgi:hypothetical protein